MCYSISSPVAQFEIGFENDVYNVTEGGRVKVCVGFILSPELQDAVLNEVFVFIVPLMPHTQPLAGESIVGNKQFVSLAASIHVDRSSI